MKIIKPYGSENESLKNELENPKCFEGGTPTTDISVLAEKMKKFDPDGKKALKIAKKYR